MPNYHYIITGAGCAGLSLLARMLKHPYFGDKQILVIDHAPKTTNDRTWCFWETHPGFFEPIVYHRWQKLQFYSQGFSSPINIAPYQYKMIRGIDFYNHVLQQARQCPNIHFMYGTVDETGNENNLGYASVGDEKFYASYIFNSIAPSLIAAGYSQNAGTHLQAAPIIQRQVDGGTHLLQHFKGWMIETPENLFNASEATFMDFRVSQQHATTFVYLLPVAPNKALVEYTVISGQVANQAFYNEGLRHYIHRYVTQGHYTITEEEFGVIPMGSHKYPPANGRVINIGTAGGQTKGSSGFTFQFIQKHSQNIVKALASNLHPVPKVSFLQARFRFYDHILLHVISTGKMQGDRIFSRLFKKIQPQTILRFLDNESSLLEELKIMASMPMGIFLPAAVFVGTKHDL